MKDWRIAVAAVVATGAAVGAAKAVTDTAFTYSQPKTGWLTVVPAELAPPSAGLSYFADFQQFLLQSNTSACFTAGLHLPQAATVTQLTVVDQSGAGTRPTFILLRVALATGTTENLAVIAPNDDSNTRKFAAAIPFASTSVINNNSFNYAFVACLASTDNIFYGARVAYTYRSAGD